jgi:hypothetical protein
VAQALPCVYAPGRSGQIQIGGSLYVQVGRAAMKFIKDAEIDVAIPGPKLFLDVEDDQIIGDIPDQAMRLDLARGQGARNLNQIADLNRMTPQEA